MRVAFRLYRERVGRFRWFHMLGLGETNEDVRRVFHCVLFVALILAPLSSALGGELDQVDERDIVAAPWNSPLADLPALYYAGYMKVTLDHDGRSLDTWIYYPANRSDGDHAPIGTERGPFPLLAFAHGKRQKAEYYLSYFAHLARRGFVTIAPDFPDDDINRLPEDLAFSVSYMLEQNRRAHGFFENAVDTLRLGTAGHSFGGAAAILHASIDPRIGACVALSPANSNRRPTMDVLGDLRVPLLVLGAELDGRLPVDAYARPIYNAALPVKGLVIIKGGNHYQFEDYAGNDQNDNPATITRDEQLQTTRRYLSHFFDLFLRYRNESFTWIFGRKALADTAIQLSYSLVDLPPFPFRLIDPPMDAVIETTKPKLEWEDVGDYDPNDPVGFKLIYSEHADFSDSVAVDTGPDSFYQFDSDLPKGKRLFWYVVAEDAQGQATRSLGTGWFLVADGEAVVQIVAPAHYRIQNLGVGDQYYIDRDYTITALPDEFAHFTWIRTANDDKEVDADQFLILSLRDSVKVYVGYDRRATSVPGWLSNRFQPTGQSIGVTDEAEYLEVWEGVFPPGTLALGGNLAVGASGAKSMYAVLFASSVPSETGVAMRDGGARGKPEDFLLSQSYPNPYRATEGSSRLLRIDFETSRTLPLQIAVYDLLGRRVRLIKDGHFPPGHYTIVWDGTDERGMAVPPGQYFYCLEGGEITTIQKLLIVR